MSTNEFEITFKSYYTCPVCGAEWIDYWDSACDSECGNCGTTDITPTHWEELED
jgi:ribosomal protein S27E